MVVYCGATNYVDSQLKKEFALRKQQIDARIGQFQSSRLNEVHLKLELDIEQKWYVLTFTGQALVMQPPNLDQEQLYAYNGIGLQPQNNMVEIQQYNVPNSMNIPPPPTNQEYAKPQNAPNQNTFNHPNMGQQNTFNNPNMGQQ